ncbi:MAG TPA: MFS transporter [Baekduia sp.]|jgi:EmrB/QacA subfamily drug resistance transporter
MVTDTRARRRTFVVLALSLAVYSLLQSLVVPALPQLRHALGTSETTTAWVLTAYLLSASVGTPILGRLGDMYGKDRVLVAVLLMLAAGTLICALSTAAAPLIAGRTVQGAAGGLFPLSFAIIRDEFPQHQVAGAIGFLSALIGIGAGLGVVLAGLIVEHLSYHWLFWLPLIGILAVVPLAVAFVPPSPVRVKTKINWPGALLLSVGLTVALLAVTRTTAWGWTSPRTLLLALAGATALALWVRSELRSDHPLVDIAMLRLRTVWTTNLAAILIGVGMYASFVLIPQYVQEPRSTGYGFAASLPASGLFLVPLTLGMLLVGQAAGRLERRVGSRASLMLGAALAAAAYALLTVARGAHLEVYAASALLGAGIGLGVAAMTNLIVQSVRQDQTGVATGMNAVARTIGGAVGAQLTATVVAGHVDAVGRPTADAYTLAFGICAAGLAASILAALLIPRRRGARPPGVALGLDPAVEPASS